MNQGKVGAAFDTHIVTSIFKHSFLKIGFKKDCYRTVQGITRALSDYITRIEEMHFTHSRRRILKIRPSVRNLNLEEEENLISQ